MHNTYCVDCVDCVLSRQQTRHGTIMKQYCGLHLPIQSSNSCQLSLWNMGASGDFRMRGGGGCKLPKGPKQHPPPPPHEKKKVAKRPHI